VAGSGEPSAELPVAPTFRLRRRWWPWVLLGFVLFALAMGFPKLVEALPQLLEPLGAILGPGGRVGCSVVAIGGILLSFMIGAMIWGETIEVSPDGIADQRRWSGAGGPVPWDQIRHITYRLRPRPQLEIRLPDSRLYITDRWRPFDRLVSTLRQQAELYEIPWRDL